MPLVHIPFCPHDLPVSSLHEIQQLVINKVYQTHEVLVQTIFPWLHHCLVWYKNLQQNRNTFIACMIVDWLRNNNSLLGKDACKSLSSWQKGNIVTVLQWTMMEGLLSTQLLSKYISETQCAECRVINFMVCLLKCCAIPWTISIMYLH